MKKIFLYSFILILALGCKNPKTVYVDRLPMKEYTPAEMENAVIYEVNIRQYSPEGTFNAFTKDIPILKELGVKVLWVMPIQPISMVKRKATPEKMIEDIIDEDDKKKYLGSYYAIADYTAVHPDYGTMDDFKKLVETAHEHGIYVILDWVANHTGWDHPWINNHPEYYQKNAAGEVTEPMDDDGNLWGWADVAHLKYNPDSGIYNAMTEEMLFWLNEADIDGFRCDVANLVPLDFWKFAKSKMQEIKPVFMLMESDWADYFEVFDMGYDWKMFHLNNEIAKGKQNVHDFDKLTEYIDSVYAKKDIFMNFTSNHDENSWNGTEYERLGEAVETFAAMTYMLPGMPLIYNGQEYDSNVPLKFFEKDQITKNKGEMFPIYKKLGQLKNENPALNGGVDKASFERIYASDSANILAFKREKNENRVWYIANLTGGEKKFTLQMEGEFVNYMTGEKVNLSQDRELDFKPWQYWILTR